MGVDTKTTPALEKNNGFYTKTPLLFLKINYKSINLQFTRRCSKQCTAVLCHFNGYVPLYIIIRLLKNKHIYLLQNYSKKMKTNKLLGVFMMLVLVLGAAVSFSSCSDDDDKGGNGGGSIVGTWYFSEKDEEGEFYIEITVKENGTGSIVERESYDGQTYVDTDYFVWKADGNKLYLAYCNSADGGREIDVNDSRTWDEGGIFSISGSKLKWVWFDDEGDIEEYEKGDYDDDDIMIFKRK